MISKVTSTVIKIAKKIASFILNPRLLLCLGIAWMITNGWCYIFAAAGTYFRIGWMQAVGAAYMAFLWIPFTPEKIVTLVIAIFLMKLLFPNDKRTLGVLRDEYDQLKEKIVKRRKNREDRKNENHDGT